MFEMPIRHPGEGVAQRARMQARAQGGARDEDISM